jgi:hypothetical protein
MKYTWIAVLMMVLFGCSTADAKQYLLTAGTLEDWCTSTDASLGMCIGATTMLLEVNGNIVMCKENGQVFEENDIQGCDGTRMQLDIPDGFNVGQTAGVFVTYMKEHPEARDVPADLVVYRVLLRTFGIKELPLRKNI